MRAWVAQAYAQHPATRIGLTAQLRTMLGWSSLPWLHTIAVPTLALTAARDRLAPPVNSRIFLARIPRCEAHNVPGAGHLFLIDQARDAAPVIEAFLGGGRSSARGVDAPAQEAFQG
jgi:pimeloyl-ACP methyl ester carboxylesterase